MRPDVYCTFSFVHCYSNRCVLWIGHHKMSDEIHNSKLIVMQQNHSHWMTRIRGLFCWAQEESRRKVSQRTICLRNFNFVSLTKPFSFWNTTHWTKPLCHKIFYIASSLFGKLGMYFNLKYIGWLDFFLFIMYDFLHGTPPDASDYYS